MFYITGDIHGEWDRIEDFCLKMKTTKDDVLILLGDVAVNYYGGARDILSKKYLASLDVTLFCIHGNHEMRCNHLPCYQQVDFCGAKAYVEPEFPNIIFAIDGEVYSINDKRCMAIGGAYSVDKYFRFTHGWNWWSDEQPSEALKQCISEQIKSGRCAVDVFLTHTCPMKYIPREVFLPGIDQSSVDNSTEIWLDEIEEAADYKAWYCGHFHIDKKIDRVRFMFNDFMEFEGGNQNGCQSHMQPVRETI